MARTKSRDAWERAMLSRQPEKWRAEGPDYYDGELRYHTQKPRIEAHFRRLAERAAGYTVGSVLDLGCGLGWVSDYIGDRKYVGIDFSPFAVGYATAHTKNPNAAFLEMDITRMDIANPGVEMLDTVVALEFLEHIEDPVGAVRLMSRLARRRIVVSVPRDMPGEGHVWGTWERGNIEGLLGDLSLCERFGRWWIAVHDMEGEE